jgi:hypothetical protein
MSSNKNKCSICGSKGTRMTNCPLNKRAKNPNPQKHPNAVKILQERVTKSKKTKQKVIVRKSQLKQNFINPYIKITQKSCKYTSAIIQTLAKNRGVIITGLHLQNIGFIINRSQNVNITIPHTIRNRNKTTEFLQLICDMISQLSQYKVDRKDYFIKPNKDVLKLLQLVEGLKTEFIKYLLTFITRDGGTPDYIDDFNQPLDVILHTVESMEALIGLDSAYELTQLPEVPTDRPQINQQTTDIAEKIAISIENEK